MPKQIATPFIHSDSLAAQANKAVSDGYKAADAALETAYKAADTAINAAYKAADKTISDAATALTARVAALETPSTNNTNYVLSGSPYTAAVAIGLRSLVHVRTDGKIEPADDSVQGKEANGIVDGIVAAGASATVYGTGARFSSVGLSSVQPGSQIFLGTSGASSLSSTGVNRQIQQVGIFRNGLFFSSFDDPGYWIQS
jgi:hypothetical protein